ncbi:MAG: hypothetical protein N2578_08080, partial [Bdellovibrionaceae bacterium]|nr:hypothetical protein [Pseudobdellovibrionaceae bacterium]
SILPPHLRSSLTLDSLVGDRVFMHLQDLNIEMVGQVARTQLLGKEGYLVAVDYADEAPEYWRECLVDLLPRPGEI